MKAMSLFSGGGIGETYLKNTGIHTVIANELIESRADIYKYRFSGTDMVVGDIKELKEELIAKGKLQKPEILLATPPCQGMSMLGKKDYKNDLRNFLIFDIFDIIDALDFGYIFIENVPKFLKMFYFKDNDDSSGDPVALTDLLNDKYGCRYNIRYGVYDASDYGVPQRRKRAIIQMYKKGLVWGVPQKHEHHITVREAIGHLPDIEANTKQTDARYPYHNGPSMNYRHIEMMKHTPTGCSAYDNKYWNPKKADNGYRISGFKDTYSRIKWDDVCPTITMHSGNISGSSTGHPGKLVAGENGNENSRVYSNARTLTIHEIMLLDSLPEDTTWPDSASEKTIREIIGEGIPPRMSEAFLSMIGKE